MSTEESDFLSVLESTSSDDSDNDTDSDDDSNLETHPILSSNADNELNSSVPEHIRNEAEEITLDLIPEKSRMLYIKTYNEFKSWRRQKVKTNSFDEDVLLVYFKELSKKYAPSCLWPIYSKLKITFLTFDKISMKGYERLFTFINRRTKNYQTKKAEPFFRPHIAAFLNSAPDDIYLLHKVFLFILAFFLIFILIKKFLF